MSYTPGTPAAQPEYRAPRPATETKPSFKTTEFYAWIIVSLAILIASALVDKGDDGQGFGAADAWWYVAFVTVGYMISRGLAKAGSRSHNHD
ncbi:MAG: hypothetical protein JWR33_113 [Naasia sp.]|jgi:hypothetical protein|uniref:hypothetical protein n=1 Tax=Naasia sp. TaxID=2546198 RepID=UPI00260FA62F|nr:hypothetical protein [Naasia sp.]MCU1569372.1 hypothetical protein [Naasia sp.]